MDAQQLAVVTFAESEQAFDALKALEASSGPIVQGSVVATKDLSGNMFLHETTKEKIGGMTAVHSSADWPVCLLAQLRQFSERRLAH